MFKCDEKFCEHYNQFSKHNCFKTYEEKYKYFKCEFSNFWGIIISIGMLLLLFSFWVYLMVVI